MITTILRWLKLQKIDGHRPSGRFHEQTAIRRENHYHLGSCTVVPVGNHQSLIARHVLSDLKKDAKRKEEITQTLARYTEDDGKPEVPFDWESLRVKIPRPKRTDYQNALVRKGKWSSDYIPCGPIDDTWLQAHADEFKKEILK